MTDNWHFVGHADDVEEEDVIEATVGRLELAIYNVGGAVYATSNICTHGQASLSEGVVIDEIIECPLDQGRFHIPTRAPRGAPVSKPIRTYPTKAEGGKIYVLLDVADASEATDEPIGEAAS